MPCQLGDQSCKTGHQADMTCFSVLCSARNKFDLKTGHQADMTCFSVLCSARNKFDLPAMEQLQIRRLKPDLIIDKRTLHSYI